MYHIMARRLPKRVAEDAETNEQEFRESNLTHLLEYLQAKQLFTINYIVKIVSEEMAQLFHYVLAKLL